MIDRALYRTVRRLMVLCAAIGLSSCDTSPLEVSGLQISDLAGVWELNVMSFANSQDPSVQIDLMAVGGATTFSIRPAGSFTGTVFLPDALTGVGDVTVPLSGVMRVTNDATCLRIDFVPEIPPFFTAMEPTLQLVGETLTLFDDVTEFDFDQDGVSEPAEFRVVAVRK